MRSQSLLLLAGVAHATMNHGWLDEANKYPTPSIVRLNEVSRLTRAKVMDMAKLQQPQTLIVIPVQHGKPGNGTSSNDIVEVDPWTKATKPIADEIAGEGDRIDSVDEVEVAADEDEAPEATHPVEDTTAQVDGTVAPGSDKNLNAKCLPEMKGFGPMPA
jgi:hypothetical protein